MLLQVRHYTSGNALSKLNPSNADPPLPNQTAIVLHKLPDSADGHPTDSWAFFFSPHKNHIYEFRWFFRIMYS